MLNLTKNDIANIIAFGNKCQMSGLEADTWVELKTRLHAEGERLHQEEKAGQLKAVD